MKKIIGIAFSVFTCALSPAQNKITATFSTLNNQQVKLVGFTSFNAYTIDSVVVNDKGRFTLSYGKEDYGMGYLVAENNIPFFVILDQEGLQIRGEILADAASIEIKKGKQNQYFATYASEHPRREQALSAWDYLEEIYKQDSLFAFHDLPKQAIWKEKKRIEAEDSLFLAGLPQESYVSWYLPLRKLVSSVSVIAQYRTAEIPAAIASFRNIDYTDPRLYKSGLLGDVIDSHFWLIENSGHSLDSVYIEMNKSIDHIAENLIIDEQKLNEITEYLFKFLEKRSLFPVSEYLAIKLLNEKSCTINNDFASQLESYRAMKKGNTAPDIFFTGDVFAPGYTQGNIPQKMSAIQSNYTVVVFGAGWCPQCPQELRSIAQNYRKWKQYGVEVVFVSLDEDKQTFKNFAGIFPFISMCDYQKWESSVVKTWHVFATPTIYLLNNNREILLKPNTASQLDSWIDWYLVEGNK